MLLLRNLSANPYYWLGLAFVALALELGALFYQYVLDYPPCVLCIQVRLWVAALFVVGVVGFFLRRSKAIHGVNLLALVSAIGMFERSWQTLATERLWTIGTCGMDAGLPAWFALDEWLPWLFGVKTSCGYTPYIIFKITMAEILVVISALLVLISLAVGLATLFKKNS